MKGSFRGMGWKSPYGLRIWKSDTVRQTSNQTTMKLLRLLAELVCEMYMTFVRQGNKQMTKLVTVGCSLLVEWSKQRPVLEGVVHLVVAAVAGPPVLFCIDIPEPMTNNKLKFIHVVKVACTGILIVVLRCFHNLAVNSPLCMVAEFLNILKMGPFFPEVGYRLCKTHRKYFASHHLRSWETGPLASSISDRVS